MEIFSISQQFAQNPGFLQPAWDCLSRHTAQESFAAPEELNCCSVPSAVACSSIPQAVTGWRRGAISQKLISVTFSKEWDY